MPPMDSKPTGRVVFDARGQAIWEWEVAPGEFSRDPDTGMLPALAVDNPLSLAAPDEPVSGQRAPGNADGAGDPRNQAVPRAGAVEAPRKSLDDLRRLSEDIKRARYWPAPTKKRP